MADEIKNAMKPMIAVPRRDVSPISRNYQSAASKLNSSNNSRSKSKHGSELDLSTEWKHTPFKTISAIKPSPKISPDKPTFDQTLQPRRNPSPTLTNSSSGPVKIVESTLEITAEEEKEILNLSNSDEKHPNPMY